MSASHLDLYCLCADWCGTCREYQALWQTLANEPGLRLFWVDIEDEAEVIGDLDIETFPTLLLARGAELLFFGPVLPGEAAVRQLLGRAQRGETLQAPDPEAKALLQRLRL